MVTMAAVFALAACGGPTPASGDVRHGAAEVEAVVVVASDNEFEPEVLELEPGTQVTIEVDNQGERAHNLVIEELDLSTGTLEPEDLATATFTVPDSPVTFYCSFHPGMEGELRPARRSSSRS
jgi:plastocyanin